MKTTQEKIKEKERTLSEINTTLVMSMELYQITTSQYGELYNENKAKVDGKHIAGIASLLSRINDLLRTRNDIENEINALLELEEAAEPNPNEIKGGKEAILTLLQKKKEEGAKEE